MLKKAPSSSSYSGVNNSRSGSSGSSSGSSCSSSEDECDGPSRKLAKVDPRLGQIEIALQKEDFAVQDGELRIEYTRPGPDKGAVITQMINTIEANMRHYYDLPNVNEENGWIWDKEKLRRDISDNVSRYFLCYSEADGKSVLAGFAVVKFEVEDLEDDIEAGWCIYVYEIHVTPEGKGKGVGTRLLHALERLVASLDGATMLRLTCFLENRNAMAFYRKNGFSLDPDSPSPLVFKDVPHAILRKVLK